MSDAKPTSPDGLGPFDTLYQLMADLPAETARIQKLLQSFSDGFLAVAEVTSRIAEHQAMVETTATMGMAALQDELAKLRRDNNILAGQAMALRSVIKKMVIEVTTESPIPGTEIAHKDPMKRIEDARAIGLSISR